MLARNILRWVKIPPSHTSNPHFHKRYSIAGFRKKQTFVCVSVTSGVHPCLKRKPLTEYFDFMGNSVAAVIRLMTQPRQTLQFLWKPFGKICKALSFHTRSDKRKSTERKKAARRIWITHRNIAPFDTGTIWCHLDRLQIHNCNLEIKKISLKSQSGV